MLICPSQISVGQRGRSFFIRFLIFTAPNRIKNDPFAPQNHKCHETFSTQSLHLAHRRRAELIFCAADLPQFAAITNLPKGHVDYLKSSIVLQRLRLLPEMKMRL